MTRFFLGQGDGFELIVAGNSPAASPPHTHVSTVTLLMIRAGTATLTISGAARVLRKKQSAVIPPHTLHALAPDRDFEAIALCLDRSFFAPRLRPERAAALARFLNAAAAENLLPPAEKNALFKLAREAELRADDADDALARLRRELEARPEEEKSLADMARQACIDKGRLVRSFKKRYGLAPAGFRRQNRLRKARRELVRARSLTAAAVNAGFFDQSHFIRHFKKLHGMTPSRYLASVQHSGGKNFASSSSPFSPARTE